MKIKLTEGKLRQIVTESVKRVLMETMETIKAKSPETYDEKENETSSDNNSEINLSLLKEKIISLCKNKDYDALHNMYDEYGVWFPFPMAESKSIKNMFMPFGNTNVYCIAKKYHTNKKHGTITNDYIKQEYGEYWDKNWSKIFYTNKVKYVLSIHRYFDDDTLSIFPSLVSKDNVNYYRINDEGKQIGPTYTKVSPHFGQNRTILLMDTSGNIYCCGGLMFEDKEYGQTEKKETEPIIKKGENVIIGHHYVFDGVPRHRQNARDSEYCCYNIDTKELFNIEYGIMNLLIYSDVEYVRVGNKYVFFKIN